MPEWYISSLMMDRALDAVVRRVKRLDRKHDIPYLAGYSKDGKIIYIDRHMPKIDAATRAARSTPTAISSCTRRWRRR